MLTKIDIESHCDKARQFGDLSLKGQAIIIQLLFELVEAQRAKEKPEQAEKIVEEPEKVRRKKV